MKQLLKDKNFLWLCLATFFMSSCLQLIWIVAPFIIKFIGGSDTDVGLCFMGQMGIYVVFCILLSSVIDNFKPKRVLVIGSIAELIIVILLIVSIYYSSENNFFIKPVWQIFCLMALIGVVTAFFWPTMMGWISRGYEGAILTKRFGFYNTTWASANMILPIIGGYLIEINYSLPVILAAIMTAGSLLASYATSVSEEGKNPTENNPDDNNSIPDNLQMQNKPFLWLSRVSLFATFICVGIFRSQLGIFYKFELGFAESTYGWSVSLMCLFNIITFWLMGRRHNWHYRKSPYIAAQALLVICMLVIIFSRHIFWQLLSAGLTGICYSVAYSTHQYYGVSGGKKRSGLMAVHEILLGAGFATGSLVGGILSDAFGRYAPYWFSCIIIITAGLVQILLWSFLTKRLYTAKA